MLITNQSSQDYWFGPLHLAGGVGQTLTVDDTTATSLYLTDDSVADAINTLAASNIIQVTGAASPFPRPTGTPQILHGDGSPEGIVYAGQGSIYLRRDNAGGSQLYQKTTGIHVNTGWVGFTGAALLTPTGAVQTYAGTAAPAGWLICDGSAVSRTTYADLFGIIQTRFGAGDGTSTFNLPDLRGRVAVGFAASGGHVDVSTLGANDGQAAANRRPKHRTTDAKTVAVGTLALPNHGHSDTISFSDTGHTHEGYVGSPNAAGGSSAFGWSIPSSNRSGSASAALVKSGSVGNPTSNPAITGAPSLGGSIGTNNANDALDAPSYLVLNHIIKT